MVNAYAQTSPFQAYDNYAALDYFNTFSSNDYTTGGFNLKAEALFDNGIWLGGHAGYLLYVNRPNISPNKMTGAELGITAGYAFALANKRLNLIPYLQMQHNGLALSSGDKKVVTKTRQLIIVMATV